MAHTFLGTGIYTFSEASRLTGVSHQRVRAWFEGWPRGLGPALSTDYATSEQQISLISFLDLIDVLVAGHLRARGLTLQYLRRAYRALEQDLETEHPFARHELLTDGQRLFRRTAQVTGDTELLDVVDRQQAFDDVLRPYLTRIDWDKTTRLARRWHLADGVVLDPARRFGKPILHSSAIPTDALAAAYKSNGRDPDLVADWYDVAPADVLRAVDFEARSTGIAA